MLVTSIFSYSQNVFKASFFMVVKSRDCMVELKTVVEKSCNAIGDVWHVQSSTKTIKFGQKKQGYKDVVLPK